MGLEVRAKEADHLDDILSRWGVGTGFGDHRLRIDSVGELSMDSISHMAYLREPHKDDGGYGEINLSPEKLIQAVKTIYRYGWRPAIHVGGDKALDMVLDAYEAADAQSPIRDKRWIVEHIPLVHPDQMDRMQRLGVVISAQFQPYGDHEQMIRVWGKERADMAVPMRQLLDHHLIVSGGSDWPGEDNNPFIPIYFYVTRKTTKGELAGPSEKISRAEALRVSTVNNAYVTFEEDAKGSLEAGKLADFLVLSGDILTVPEDQILSLKPLATYVGGKKAYSSGEGGF